MNKFYDSRYGYPNLTSKVALKFKGSSQDFSLQLSKMVEY